MKFEIKIVVINQFGQFIGETMILNKSELENLENYSKSFYSDGGFELNCGDGSFVVFPPDVVKQSIVKIERKSVI